MATHSSVLAWRIPGTGEPGGLPTMGPHRVGHDWGDLAAAAASMSLFSKIFHNPFTRQETGPASVSVSSAFTNWKILISYNNSEKKKSPPLRFFQPKAHPFHRSELEFTQGIVWLIVNDKTMNSPFQGCPICCMVRKIYPPIWTYSVLALRGRQA